MIDMTNPTEPRKQRVASHTGKEISDDMSRSATLLTDGGDENNENDETERGDETQVLYLDVEGLFLDILGLEVDLDEIVLDVSAVPGSGKLLGNLLSAVGGVLDGGLPDVLNGILPDDMLSMVLPDDILDEMALDDRIPSFPDIIFGFVNILLDIVLDALEDGESSEESPSNTQ